MPGQLISYVPERVLYLYASGIFTAEEFAQMDDAGCALLAQSPAPQIHLIVDQRHVTQVPSLRVQSKVRMARQPQLGWVLIIGRNVIIQSLSIVIGNFFKLRLRYFDSFEEAVAFLQHADATLPDLNAPAYRQNIHPYIPLKIRR